MEKGLRWTKCKDALPIIYKGEPTAEAAEKAQMYIVCANNDVLYHCYYVGFAAQIYEENGDEEKPVFNDNGTPLLAWFNEDGDCYDYLSPTDLYIPLPQLPNNNTKTMSDYEIIMQRCDAISKRMKNESLSIKPCEVTKENGGKRYEIYLTNDRRDFNTTDEVFAFLDGIETGVNALSEKTE